MNTYTNKVQFYIRGLGRFVPAGSEIFSTDEIDKVVIDLAGDKPERLTIDNPKFNKPDGTTWEAYLISDDISRSAADDSDWSFVERVESTIES